MLDLYTVIVPLLGILSILYLVLLKLSYLQLNKIAKLHTRHKVPPSNRQTGQYTKVAKHLLGNYTLAEVCVNSRAKNKIGMVVALSLISILCFAIPSPFVFCWVGLACYALILASELYNHYCCETESKVEACQSHKYTQTIMISLAIVVNIVLIGLTFKSYKNIMMGQLLANIGITFALDNLVVRPLALLLLALPLSKSQTMCEYVQVSERVVILLTNPQKLAQLVENSKIYSPSKLKKFGIEIEPIPIIKHNDLKQDEDKENRKQFQDKYDILKRIKKQRVLPPLITPYKAEHDASLNSLFSSNQKDESIIDDLESNGQDKTSAIFKNQEQKNKANSQQLLLVNGTQREKNVENQEDEDIESVNHKQKEDSKPITERVDNGDSGPLRIRMSDGNSMPLRIGLGNQQQFQEQETQTRKSTINRSETNRKNTLNVLEVKDTNQVYDQMEEIQINHQPTQDVQKKKKKNKRLSCGDEKRRVIKFTTGQPYLEYLPNMLNKKKSQVPLVRKEFPFDSRMISSVKRPKKMNTIVHNENDENQIPQLNVEDL